MLKGKLPLLVVVLAAVGGAGCGNQDSADGGPSVAASTTHVADLARAVGGERVEVRGLLSPGADPHEYEPRPSDVQAVSDAEVVLKSGGDLDEWMDELVDSAGDERSITSLINSVKTRQEGDEVDPHWWHDPRNVRLATIEIRDRLTDADPEGARDYRANADAYLLKLERLDSAIARCMSGVPVEQRKLVTNHDALGYLAERYEIEVVGAVIPALTTEAQPSVGEIDELVQVIREEDVKAIFPESGVSGDLERTIAEASGAQVGGELWADALGPEGSSGETYLDSLAANASTLLLGFTGGTRACETGP